MRSRFFKYLILSLVSLILIGCSVSKRQYRDALLSKLDSNMQDILENNAPEYINCFSGDKGIKIALFSGAYWECVWELDDKLPEQVSVGSDLTKWTEDLDACGLTTYMEKMFKKDDVHFQKDDPVCSGLLQGYYLVSPKIEREEAIVDTLRDVIVSNVIKATPGVVSCFDLDEEKIKDAIWETYIKGLAPLTIKYENRLPADKQEIESGLTVAIKHFAALFYQRTKQFYSTTKLSAAEKQQCDSVILADIRLYSPGFTEPERKEKGSHDAVSTVEENQGQMVGSKARLTKLKELYEEGIITESEYLQKRKSILDSL